MNHSDRTPDQDPLRAILRAHLGGDRSPQVSRDIGSWTSLAEAALDSKQPRAAHAWFDGPREIARLACIGLARRNGWRSKAWQELIAKLESMTGSPPPSRALAETLGDQTKQDAADWNRYLDSRSSPGAGEAASPDGKDQLRRLARTDVLSLACMELAYRADFEATAAECGIDEPWLRACFRHTAAIALHATSLEAGRAWFSQLAATLAPEARLAARHAPRLDHPMQLGDRALGLASGWILDATRLAPPVAERDEARAAASAVSALFPAAIPALDSEGTPWTIRGRESARFAEMWRLFSRGQTTRARSAAQRDFYEALDWLVQDHAPVRAAAAARRWSSAGRVSWSSASGRWAEWTFDREQASTRVLLRFFDSQGEPARDLEGAVVPWMGLFARVQDGRAHFERDEMVRVLGDFLQRIAGKELDGQLANDPDATQFERLLESLRVGEERYEIAEPTA